MKSKKIISLVIATSLTSSLFVFNGTKAFAATDKPRQNIVTTLPTENTLNSNTNGADFSSFMSALTKTQAIKAGESKDNATIGIKISNVDWSKLNLSANDQASINLLLNALQNIPITSDTKFTSTGLDMTSESDSTITLSSIPLNFKTWTSINTSSGTPTGKVICQIPTALKGILAFMPTSSDSATNDALKQLTSKNYIYYDSSELAKDASINLPKNSNSQEYAVLTKDFIQKLISQIISNAQTENSGIMTKNSDSEYELKINNSSINKLLEQFVSDSTTQKIVIDYLVSATELSSKDNGKQLTKNDINKLTESFTNLIDLLKNSIPTIEKSLSGITFNLDIKYTIGSEGYISKQSGTFNLTLDGKALSSQATSDSLQTNKSLGAFENASIDISSTFSNTLSDLGASVTIDPMPTITADNSIDYSALLAQYLKANEAQAQKDLEKGKAKLEIKNNPSKFSNKTSNNANKSWNITFKKAIDPSTVNDSTIMIVDDDLNPVECDLSVKDNIITVTPKQAYSKNKIYHIYISDSITDTNGVHLPRAIHQDFTIK